MVIESHGVLVYRRGRLFAWSPLFATNEEAEAWAAPWRSRGRFDVLVDAGPGKPDPAQPARGSPAR